MALLEATLAFFYYGLDRQAQVSLPDFRTAWNLERRQYSLGGPHSGEISLLLSLNTLEARGSLQPPMLAPQRGAPAKPYMSQSNRTRGPE